eukprot:1161013-Pelagomonas_calceolata.AAC.14
MFVSNAAWVEAGALTSCLGAPDAMECNEAQNITKSLDEDEEEWLGKERRRMGKDLARLQPVVLAGSERAPTVGCSLDADGASRCFSPRTSLLSEQDTTLQSLSILCCLLAPSSLIGGGPEAVAAAKKLAHTRNLGLNSGAGQELVHSRSGGSLNVKSSRCWAVRHTALRPWGACLGWCARCERSR